MIKKLENHPFPSLPIINFSGLKVRRFLSQVYRSRPKIQSPSIYPRLRRSLYFGLQPRTDSSGFSACNIKKYSSLLFKHHLVKGSLIMFSGTMVANLGNYLYHLLMGRMLGPKDYGVLESIIAVVYILFILINTLALTVAKFTANLNGKKDFRGISWFFHYLNRKTQVFAVLSFFLILFFSPLIVNFLHLDSYFPVVLAGLLFSVSSVSSINRAILQGLLRFKQMVTSHISETGAKVLFAAVLVFVGLGVSGAVLSLVIGAAIGYFIALFFLRSSDKFSPRKPNLSKKTFIKFALPVFFFNLSFNSLYTNDIILVKHFFSSQEAGLYAALSVLGKIVFFATSAIPGVMFPMIATRHSQGRDSRPFLLISLIIVFSISLLAVIIYYLFPKLMILLLFGRSYLIASPLLAWMALFIAIYSLTYLLVNYFLSVDRVKVVILPAMAALSQVVLISLFHQSLRQVIWVSIGTCLFLLLSLVIYYTYGQAKGSFSYRPRI